MEAVPPQSTVFSSSCLWFSDDTVEILRTSCSTIPCASRPNIDGWNKASPTVYRSLPIFITWTNIWEGNTQTYNGIECPKPKTSSWSMGKKKKKNLSSMHELWRELCLEHKYCMWEMWLTCFRIIHHHLFCMISMSKMIFFFFQKKGLHCLNIL